ncbi:MocR-like pyridoxine biosynthesis transcription factor PdxR [Jiangella alkaliphila]|uniref:GntR family transcriptional regulator / MocR family aminotransferase n=1 Tax=Jiangella alkaliphila TaxID=419479 RepID=A0A1H2JJ62_9ACTN|nr:PLP-dependent aminotransferase family protein [Jiangella alkaliphila]SDU56574.1 GntR family transcriptional regulator / MocR family aminotransferase [Jiangella alkaliphila]
MPRRINLHVTLTGDGDLSGQIHRRIRQVILDGLMEHGELLPSTRDLAARLCVSRTTVGTAYDRLMAEGLVKGRVGVGTFVTGSPAGARARPSAATSPLRPAPLWPALPASCDAAAGDVRFDLRPGRPDPRQFPFSTWRSELSRHTNAEALSATSSDVAGPVALRSALAQHLGLFHGVPAEPDDVVVTTGARQAVELAARVLLEPGDLVAVEEPGHRDLAALFTSLGLHVVPVRVDAEGLVVDAIPSGVRCVYTRAARHFPLGRPLSADRRVALLDWAGRVDGVIVEDGHDGEFRHTGRPIDPLRGLDRSGRVLYAGSLARLLRPDVRIGYLVAPAPLHAVLHKAKQVLDPEPATPVQLAAAAFLRDGHLSRHVRRMRAVYTERRERLITAATWTLGEHATLQPSPTGLDVPALFRDPHLDDVEVARQAASAGVAVAAISDRTVTGRHRGLLLGFGALPTDHVEESLTLLRTAIESVATGEPV